MSINTSAKCEHNRPDIVVWDRGATVCSIREIDSSTDLKIIGLNWDFQKGELSG